jgi:hypothetical protein
MRSDPLALTGCLCQKGTFLAIRINRHPVVASQVAFVGQVLNVAPNTGGIAAERESLWYHEETGQPDRV